MVVVVVVECGGGGGGEENKIKISTKCILFTIIFNTCLTTKQVYVQLYTFYLKKHIKVYVQLFTILFKQYPHILAPG